MFVLVTFSSRCLTPNLILSFSGRGKRSVKVKVCLLIDRIGVTWRGAERMGYGVVWLDVA